MLVNFPDRLRPCDNIRELTPQACCSAAVENMMGMV
jgi:hypothetical protein